MQESTRRSLLSPLEKKRNRRDEIVVFGIQYKADAVQRSRGSVLVRVLLHVVRDWTACLFKLYLDDFPRISADLGRSSAHHGALSYITKIEVDCIARAMLFVPGFVWFRAQRAKATSACLVGC